MIRSLALLFIYIAFISLTVRAPFVATLGYLWVDTFQPQYVAYILLNQFPPALVMGLAAIGGYFLIDRRSPPPLSRETVLSALMAVWVTCTLAWAQVPDAAWTKWDWAFKTLAFATFVPYVIRSRVQIEAFAQTYVMSLAANFVPFGIKTIISGGGYGVNLGLQSGNTGLSEGGLLSTVCLMAVPLSLSLSKYRLLTPNTKLVTIGYWIVAILAIFTAVGTFERSALLGLVVLGIYMWVRSKNKVAFGLAIAIVACVLIYSSSSGYDSRMSTIGNADKEESAFARLLVWRWTLGFVASHPLGGGFVAYLVDFIDIPEMGGIPAHTQFGRAFHSSYFEVLGEHGYPGLAIFLTLAISMFFRLRSVSKKARQHPELQWLASMSDALQAGLAVFMTSGAFVGVAFQPMFWNFIAMGVSLNAYMWRVEHLDQPVGVGWRAVASRDSTAPAAAPETPGWRNRTPRPAATRPLGKSA